MIFFLILYKLTCFCQKKIAIKKIFFIACDITKLPLFCVNDELRVLTSQNRLQSYFSSGKTNTSQILTIFPHKPFHFRMKPAVAIIMYLARHRRALFVTS